MGYFSIWHWVIVVALALVIFGSKKVSKLVSEIGFALKNFRDSLNSTDKSNKDDNIKDKN